MLKRGNEDAVVASWSVIMEGFKVPVCRVDFINRREPAVAHAYPFDSKESKLYDLSVSAVFRQEHDVFFLKMYRIPALLRQ